MRAQKKLLLIGGGILARYRFSTEGFKEYKDYQFDFGWIRFIYNREFLLRNDLFFPDRVYYEDPVWFVKTMSKVKKFYTLTRSVYVYRTGFKDCSLSYNKILDLLKGVLDNIHVAEEKQYCDLLHLEIRRITQDYCREIIKYIGRKDSLELQKMIEKLNAELHPYGYNHIDYDMFRWANFHNMNELRDKERCESEQKKLELINALNNKNCEIHDLTNRLTEVYHSMTWKVGDFFLWIPKFIARKIRHEGRK